MTDRLIASLDLAAMIGGRRGVIDMSIPGVTLVVVDTFAPLGWAIAAALGSAACVAVLRMVRGEPLRQATMGLAGLAGAAALAAVTGDAKTYFLPGILLNAVYAVLTLASILVGRPALGYVIAFLDSRYAHWQHDPALRRAATFATALWSVVFALRAGVQGYLYTHHGVEWLAPARLGMGLPLWALALAGTLLILEGRAGER